MSSEHALEFTILFGGILLLAWHGMQTRDYRRLLIYSPVPLIWAVMYFLIKWNPEFWETNLAAIPAVAIVGATLAYSITAIKWARRLK